MNGMTSSMRSLVLLCTLFVLGGDSLRAAPPVASYIFPAGGQRGTTVPVRVGGLFLHQRCGFDLNGPGVKSTPELKKTDRVWFEGPLLPLPDSQRQEDYPADMLGSVALAANAPLGPVKGRLWTSQGVAPGLVFVVGDLPEIVEHEIDGDPTPHAVTLPVTANGRIFPREDVDLWSFQAKKGQTVSALAMTQKLSSPLVAKLEILDSSGNVVVESGSHAVPGYDTSVRFTATADGTYQVRISDVRSSGGPEFVYRLTVTAGPVVDHVFPLGGRSGTKLAFSVSGQNTPTGPVTTSLPMTRSIHAEQLSFGGLQANPITLDVDDLPEFLTPTGGPIEVPAMLNGRIQQLGEVQEWKLTLKKSTKYEMELRARNLGSPLCGVVTLTDSTGKELSRTEANDLASDPSLSFTAPATGVYAVRVAERFRSRGGPSFAYRLRISEAETPMRDFRLKLGSEVLNVPRSGTAKLKVAVERLGGFAEPIKLSATGLPPGLTMTTATIEGRQSTIDLTFSAESAAHVKMSPVTITGTANSTSHVAEPVFVAATVPTPFKFGGEYTMNNSPRGQLYRRTYKLERNGFEGPIKVQLADRQIRHLQGVTAPKIVVPPGQTQFEYACQLPAEIEIGRTCRVTIMASGIVIDADGTEHTVCFTSGEQNHQMIVVPEPGRLAIDLDKTNVIITPGKPLRFPFQISRAVSLTGATKVELLFPAHWNGVVAKSVEVAADVSRGELEIHVPNGTKLRFNLPATIRATIQTDRGPVIAETKLELLLSE